MNREKKQWSIKILDDDDDGQMRRMMITIIIINIVAYLLSSSFYLNQSIYLKRDGEKSLGLQ